MKSNPLDLLSRHGVTYHVHQTYELAFSEVTSAQPGNARRHVVIRGAIYYLVNGRRSGIMSHGDPLEIRWTWHRLARINRARRSGRPYLHIIAGYPSPRFLRARSLVYGKK